MTERAPIPDPPTKSRIGAADGTFTLQWLVWLGALVKWVQRVRVFRFAIDVPSIPSGASWVGDFTIANVAVGDFAAASFDPTDPDLVVTAHATAVNTIRVRAQNLSGGAIDLAAGVIFIRVERAR